MKNEKLKTKAMVLAICAVLLVGMGGVMSITALYADMSETSSGSGDLAEHSIPTIVEEKVGADFADLTDIDIAFDVSHGERSDGSLDMMKTELTDRGATITDIMTGPITPGLLNMYDILWIDERGDIPWSSSEKTAVYNWVIAGHGLVFHGDEIGTAIELAEMFNIGYTGGGVEGSTTNILHPHPVTGDVNTAYCPGPMATLSVVAPAYTIVWDTGGYDRVACNEPGGGRVVFFGDEFLWYNEVAPYLHAEDNDILANQAFDWVACLCPAEYAVYQAGVPNPDGFLNPLRELRDDNLKDEYVDRYYDYSPELTMVITRDPALALEAARLLVKYSPMVKHKVYGIGVDKQITRRDVKEIASFTDRLERSVRKNRDEIGAERSQELLKFLDEFKGQVKASEGKTFSEALQDSIYCKDEQMPGSDDTKIKRDGNKGQIH